MKSRAFVLCEFENERHKEDKQEIKDIVELERRKFEGEVRLDKLTTEMLLNYTRIGR